MSSDSSSEDSGSGEADTMRTIYKGLAEVLLLGTDNRGWEYDPDYAFRLNDAKLDAAAIACFALRFVTRETDGDARLEEAVDKAGWRLQDKFLSQLERAGEGRKRKRQSLHESLKEALEREQAKAAR